MPLKQGHVMKICPISPWEISTSLTRAMNPLKNKINYLFWECQTLTAKDVASLSHFSKKPWKNSRKKTILTRKTLLRLRELIFRRSQNSLSAKILGQILCLVFSSTMMGSTIYTTQAVPLCNFFTL